MAYPAEQTHLPTVELPRAALHVRAGLAPRQREPRFSLSPYAPSGLVPHSSGRNTIRAVAFSICVRYLSGDTSAPPQGVIAGWGPRAGRVDAEKILDLFACRA